jgi:hypothetical protein
VRHADSRRLVVVRLVCAALVILVAVPLAAHSSGQTGAVSSADRIRAQAQRMKEYRALLADPDSNIRLATLDEMLASTEPAIRELAFDAGFASADQNMRALALRARILSMKSFILEPQNTKNLPTEAWEKLVKSIRPQLGFSYELTSADAQTGNVVIRLCGAGRVAGQEFSFSCVRTVRLRLSDDAIMMGTMSFNDLTIAVRLVLQ